MSNNSYLSQKYLTPSGLQLIHAFRTLPLLATCSHSAHGNMSLHAYWRYIACLVIQFAEYLHASRLDIWIHPVYSQSNSSDYWLKMQKTTFITRISDSILFTLNLILQITDWRCRKTTFITRISYSILLTLNLILQITGCRCRKPHLSQGYLTPSCLISIRFFRLLAEDAKNHIYHKDIWLHPVNSQSNSSDYWL